MRLSLSQITLLLTGCPCCPCAFGASPGSRTCRQLRMGSSGWAERQNCFGFPQPAHPLKDRRHYELQQVIKGGYLHFVCAYLPMLYYFCKSVMKRLSIPRSCQTMMFLLRALKKNLPLVEISQYKSENHILVILSINSFSYI